MQSRANSSTDILKSESTNLFREVLKREDPPTACEINKEWYEEKISQQYLRELLAKHVGSLDDAAQLGIPFKPREILDPTGDTRRSSPR
jgi:hypothetical protein